MFGSTVVLLFGAFYCGFHCLVLLSGSTLLFGSDQLL